MARPQTVSDQAILEAARRVILRQETFALSDVADEAGLSRGAVIGRFKSTEALKQRLTAEMVDAFVQQLEQALPAERSGDALLDFVAYVAERMSNSLSTVLLLLRGSTRDAKLATLEKKRMKAWLHAISARMPKTVLSHEAAVASFDTQLAGAILQCESMPGTYQAAHLMEQAQDWLTLAKISFTKRAPRLRTRTRK